MTPTKPGHHSHDEHLYSSDADLHNEDVAHEHSDVNVRALIAFALGLAVVTALAAAFALGVFKLFERQAAANDPVLSPLSRPEGQLPREPRLLTDEPQNLQRFRDAQAEALKGIDEAKKKLLEQGLPVRPDAPTDPWLGLRSQAWGESSSGRLIPTSPGGSGSAQPAEPPAAQPAAAPAPAAPHKSGGH